MSVNSHHKKVTEKENDFNKTQTPEVHSELHRTQEMKEKVSKTKKKDSSVPLDSVDVENHVNIDSQESLNPESAVKENGEIDWDCPCLQGMAHGPCGNEFKEAFSCFVNSKEEEKKPKGYECVTYFRAMHDCMTENAEHYLQYLKDDEGEEEVDISSQSSQNSSKETNEEGDNTAPEVSGL